MRPTRNRFATCRTTFQRDGRKSTGVYTLKSGIRDHSVQDSSADYGNAVGRKWGEGHLRCRTRPGPAKCLAGHGLVTFDRRHREARLNNKSYSPSFEADDQRAHHSKNMESLVTCQCGAVSFKAPQPGQVFVCHGTECRKQSASAFGTSAVIPADSVFPLSPELGTKLSRWDRACDSGNTMECYFCKTCGVRVIHRPIQPDGTPEPLVRIKGGVMENLSWERAKWIYTRSAVVLIPPDVEQWPTSPTTTPGMTK